MKQTDTGPRSASRNPLELWRDLATGRVIGNGQCEWCGHVLHFKPARWVAEERGYILECRDGAPLC